MTNRQFHNIWQNDVGFVWMLVITVLMMINTQVTEGFITESKFVVRFGYFLFVVLAVKSSVLSAVGKSIGYLIATLMLLLAIALIRFETKLFMLLYNTFATGYMIYIIALVVNQIFAGGVITLNKIGGGVAAYILLGHLWASLYYTIYIIEPASFQYGGEVIQSSVALKHLSYFSFVTLTTVGFGDITAISSVARIFVILEALLGQLFPVIFIAKLVSLQIEHSKKL